jgi:PAS domain S-box-containing protein
MTMTDNTPSIVGIDDEWYREIVEAAPDATVMINSAGLIVLVNRQTEILFGYARHELLGQPMDVLVPERYRHKHHIHRDG